MSEKLRFSPDGTKLFHSTKNELRVWGMKERTILCQCPGSLVGISRDSQTFLTQSAQNIFHAWSGNTGAELNLTSIDPNSYDQSQRSVLLPDNKTQALEIRDILNAQSSICLNIIEIKGHTLPEIFENWAMAPDGENIAVTLYGSGAGHEWTTGLCIGIDGKKRFEFEVNRFTSRPLLYFAEYHPFLAIETRQNLITLYRLETGKPIQRVSYEYNRESDFIRIGPQQDLLTMAIPDTQYSFRIYPYPVEKGIITESEPVIDVTFHPDGKHIASVLKNKEVRLYRLETLELENIFR